MDVQVKAGCLVHAIAADDIAKATQQLTEYFRESVRRTEDDTDRWHPDGRPNTSRVR